MTINMFCIILFLTAYLMHSYYSLAHTSTLALDQCKLLINARGLRLHMSDLPTHHYGFAWCTPQNCLIFHIFAWFYRSCTLTSFVYAECRGMDNWTHARATRHAWLCIFIRYRVRGRTGNGASHLPRPFVAGEEKRSPTKNSLILTRLPGCRILTRFAG